MTTSGDVTAGYVADNATVTALDAANGNEWVATGSTVVPYSP